MKVVKSLFCRHKIKWTRLYSYKHYDQEIWEECVCCGKQLRTIQEGL